MRPLDIGAKRPIDGDLVYKVGEYLSTDPSFVQLYDASKTTLHTRYRNRNLGRGVCAQEIVDALGGEREFARLDVPGWGSAWFRRSMILDVQPSPPELVRHGRHSFGSMVLMRFEEPIIGYPFLPAGTPFAMDASGMTTDEVRCALGV